MALNYRESKLFMGDVDLSGLELTGPTFVYDLSEMENEIRLLKEAMGESAHIHFAVKSNSHPLILSHFAKMGLGADVVSAGEAKNAIAAGFKAGDIIFSGVGKTTREIAYAIEEGIGQINVESPQELERVGRLAKEKGLKVSVAFRMNPDVDAKTHPYITTGFRENKFGMDESFLPDLLRIMNENKESLDLKGVTIHIGSQLRDNRCFREAIEKTIPVFLDLKKNGHDVSVFDVGGGIGVDYEAGGVDRAQVESYGEIVRELLEPLGVKIYCEPGRVISGCHGVLLGEVQYIKKTPHKEFAILDTGMHHLIRPSLYQAYHRVLPLIERTGSKRLYDVVGPICESSDFLAKDREIHELRQGDVLAICEAGAYGRSMASQYNAHEYPDEFVFYNGQRVS